MSQQNRHYLFGVFLHRLNEFPKSHTLYLCGEPAKTHSLPIIPFSITVHSKLSALFPIKYSRVWCKQKTPTKKYQTNNKQKLTMRSNSVFFFSCWIFLFVVAIKRNYAYGPFVRCAILLWHCVNREKGKKERKQKWAERLRYASRIDTIFQMKIAIYVCDSHQFN